MLLAIQHKCSLCVVVVAVKVTLLLTKDTIFGWVMVDGVNAKDMRFRIYSRVCCGSVVGCGLLLFVG